VHGFSVFNPQFCKRTVTVPRIFPTNLVESRNTGYKPVKFTENCLTMPYSGPTCMLAGTLGACIYILSLLAGSLIVGPHICRLEYLECTYMLAAHLEHPYIILWLAGSLIVGPHICQLECLEHTYILSLLADRS